MRVRRFVGALTCLLVAAAIQVAVSGQTGGDVSGRLTNSLSGEPIPNATVQIDELNRQAMSAADGTFSFPNVPPGTYHVSVHSQGYSTRRTEVTVTGTAA